MARIVAAIARALREDTTEKVHFHGGPARPVRVREPALHVARTLR